MSIQKHKWIDPIIRNMSNFHKPPLMMCTKCFFVKVYVEKTEWGRIKRRDWIPTSKSFRCKGQKTIFYTHNEIGIAKEILCTIPKKRELGFLKTPIGPHANELEKFVIFNLNHQAESELSFTMTLYKVGSDKIFKAEEIKKAIDELSTFLNVDSQYLEWDNYFQLIDNLLHI